MSHPVCKPSRYLSRVESVVLETLKLRFPNTFRTSLMTPFPDDAVSAPDVVRVVTDVVYDVARSAGTVHILFPTISETSLSPLFKLGSPVTFPPLPSW